MSSVLFVIFISIFNPLMLYVYIPIYPYHMLVSNSHGWLQWLIAFILLYSTSTWHVHAAVIHGIRWRVRITWLQHMNHTWGHSTQSRPHTDTYMYIYRWHTTTLHDASWTLWPLSVKWTINGSCISNVHTNEYISKTEKNSSTSTCMSPSTLMCYMQSTSPTMWPFH